ncbi:MAG: 2'-5' RNA ligase family protein [Nodosilinea sp.]
MARSLDSARFFVALLPPQAVQDKITTIKQDIWQRFNSKAALESPPHITLQPPFQWPLGQVDELAQQLATFAQTQGHVPIGLEGFNVFAPRVLYIDVAKTSQLMSIQPALLTSLETGCGVVDRVAQSRSFVPHVTVGFRDLLPAAFQEAWGDYRDRSFAADFVVQNLTLLCHDGQVWQVFSEFPLLARGSVT